MNRTIALIVAAFLLLSLAGCSVPAAPAAPAATPTAEATQPAVAIFYLVAQVEDSWSATACYGKADPDPTEGRMFDSMREAVDWATAQPSTDGVRVANGSNR